MSTSSHRILVISSPRSGSTWTMRVLACAQGARFVHEPDNIDTAAAVHTGLTSLGFGAYPALGVSDPAPQYAALWDLAFQGRRALWLRRGLGRRLSRAVFHVPRRLRDPLLTAAAHGLGAVGETPPHVIVSSVMAHFAVEWIDAHFQPRVVVLQRDPLNIASSWLRYDIHAYDLHRRPDIIDGPLRRLGIQPPPSDASRITLVGWWIGALAATLTDLLERHPGWVLATHDQLCADAEAGFRALYQELGLTWTTATSDYLRQGGYVQPLFAGGKADFAPVATDEAHARTVRHQQVDAWRARLTEGQVAELTDALAAFPNRGWVRPVQPNAGRMGG